MVATARNGPGKVCMGLTKLELEAYRVTPLPEVVSGNLRCAVPIELFPADSLPQHC